MALGELVGWVALGLSILLAVLLTLQSLRVSRLQKRLRALAVGAGPGSEQMSLADLLSSQGARLEATRSEVDRLREAAKSLDASTQRSVQCIGLVRYNPFGDTGGDQSFALALLDPRGNGVVVSSLHGRTATRFYAKPVRGGTSPISLSDEEVLAIKQALEGSDEQSAQFIAR